jgi:hypothetical protein
MDNTKQEKSQFICNCGKKYAFESGLTKHKSTCKKVSGMEEVPKTPKAKKETTTKTKKPEPEPEPKVEEKAKEKEDDSDDDCSLFAKECDEDDEPDKKMTEKEFIRSLIDENQELKRIIIKQHKQLENQDERIMEYVKAFFIQLINANILKTEP